jgi:hypothetical protein
MGSLSRFEWSKPGPAAPLLLQSQETLDKTGILRTLELTATHWLDTKHCVYGSRASHNPSVVSSIPTGPTKKLVC